MATLWAHVQHLFQTQAAELRSRCRTDWQATPQDLDNSIAIIETADAASTFFRYPDTRSAEADATKSSWQPGRPEDIVERMEQGGKPVKAFLIYQPDGETVAAAFQYDDAHLAELSRTLAETAKTLSSAHTGLRVELADGF